MAGLTADAPRVDGAFRLGGDLVVAADDETGMTATVRVWEDRTGSGAPQLVLDFVAGRAGGVVEEE